jgi:C1A family cysteine protease
VGSAFAAFTDKYNKVYETTIEAELRFAIFKANYEIIEAVNAKGHPYTLTVNEFADQTAVEFGATHFGFNSADPAPAELWQGLPHLGTYRRNSSDDHTGLPESVDWTAKGAVTAPKNQGLCGSCWSFSTTGALEGAWQIATGKLISLSEQQLVDCNRENSGCGGGTMDAAFTYLKDHPVCTEEGYPYKQKAGTCQERNCTIGIPRGAIQGFEDVPQDDEEALMAAVAKGPVSVGIEADQQAFQLYGGGVLTKKCGSKLDHGVLLVGYGAEGNLTYWKIKNSWGPAWGESGYVRIAMGRNVLGIESQCAWAVPGGFTDLDNFPCFEGGENCQVA